MPITAEEKIKLVRLKIFQNCLRTYRIAILASADPDNGQSFNGSWHVGETFLRYASGNDRVKVSPRKKKPSLKAIMEVFSRRLGSGYTSEHLWASSYEGDNEKFSPALNENSLTRLIAPSKAAPRSNTIIR